MDNKIDLTKFCERRSGFREVVNTKTDCHYCKSDGKMFCGFPAPIVKLESMSFNPYYLEMFVEMPNVKYQLGENKAYFKFDGGYGLIMVCTN